MTARIDSSLFAHIPTLTPPLNQVSSLLTRLNLDQVLQGRVLAVRGNQVVISMLGEQIAAESLLPLQVGQVLNLVVREVRPDRVALQVAPKTGEEAPVLRPIADQDLSDLLSAQHLLPDRTNLLIARTLLRNSLPITNAIVLAARNALSFIGAPQADDIEAAIFLMLKELPVTRESMELAKGALLQPNNLGARVQALATQLVELLVHAEQIEQGGATTILPRHILPLAQQLLHELPLLVPDQVQGQAFAALVKQVLNQIAMPTENRLARLLEESVHTLREQEVQPSTVPVTEEIIIELSELPLNVRPDLAPLDLRPDPVKTMTSTADLPTGEALLTAEPPQPAHSLVLEQEATTPAPPARLLPEEPHQASPALRRQHPSDITSDFRQQLASMNDVLAQASDELPAHHRLAPLLRELGGAIHEMITMVEAEQLSNAGMPPPTQPQGYYVFNLPIAVAGQDMTDTAEVRIYYQRRGHTKRVDPENAHLAFLLQMSHLGPVDVHVDLYQKHLRCRIECSNDEAIGLFQESSLELQKRLHVAGYTVDSIRALIATRLNTRLNRESMPPLFKIDIQV